MEDELKKLRQLNEKFDKKLGWFKSLVEGAGDGGSWQVKSVEGDKERICIEICAEVTIPGDDGESERVESVNIPIHLGRKEATKLITAIGIACCRAYP
ncbi:hypothetical protein Mal15_42710 [Stieleria maiorica]|uniref:Uncharacterized protein n=1 Tax=Stieleria maiorica TaxID=2795974 RepID=A0A5B9MG23_9BACT|nr:hypothetical protein [Stieleria maiorica]QEG00202.1 hypothetical protein Mal15_42710 [Stieleria maiorica]